MPVWVLADIAITILSISFVLGLTALATAIPTLSTSAFSKSTIAEEAGYRKELLNLKGSFSRTVFVLDTSGSMGTAIDVSEIDKEWGKRPAPWPSVLKRMDSWLMHLPIGSFRIVCFSTELELFPKKETEWLQGGGSRNRAAEFLRGQSPGGFTCTEKAIDRALASKPTAIILFTDGMPSDTAGNADPAQQTRILNKVRTAKVPVHVVAVGNYIDQRQGLFLQLIAEQSGGGFIGF